MVAAARACAQTSDALERAVEAGAVSEEWLTSPATAAARDALARVFAAGAAVVEAVPEGIARGLGGIGIAVALALVAALALFSRR